MNISKITQELYSAARAGNLDRVANDLSKKYPTYATAIAEALDFKLSGAPAPETLRSLNAAVAEFKRNKELLGKALKEGIDIFA